MGHACLAFLSERVKSFNSSLEKMWLGLHDNGHNNFVWTNNSNRVSSMRITIHRKKSVFVSQMLQWCNGRKFMHVHYHLSFYWQDSLLDVTMCTAFDNLVFC